MELTAAVDQAALLELVTTHGGALDPGDGARGFQRAEI
jgi:hypothetical protein